MSSSVSRRRGVGLVLLFAAYVVTAKLGLRVDAVSGFAALVWPPTGIGLAALLLFGKGLWPAIALGALVVNVSAGAPLAAATGIAAGNTLEALVAAHLLTRVLRFDLSLTRVRDVLALVVGAAVASTLISAIIGPMSLWATGVVRAPALPQVWRAWWVGDGLGDLIVAPLVLVWAVTRTRPAWRSWRAEALALAAAVAFMSFYVFEIVLPRAGPQGFRWPFLIFPVAIWAAWRFRQRGATTATLIVWIVATAATVLGHRPFAAGRLNENLLSLEVFIGVLAITGLVMGAVVCERDAAARVRDQATAKVEAAERRYRFLADASRVLAAGLDYEKTMQDIARLVVPMLGDNCVVDVLASDHSIRRVAEASLDPVKETLLRGLRRYPPGPGRPGSPVVEAFKTGRTVFIPHFDLAVLQSLTAGDEYTKIVQALAPSSSVTVPLKSRDRVLGALTFGMAESRRTYQPEDIALAEELAARAAMALDNASLYDQSQQAVRARDVFLAVASHELRTPLTALDLQIENLRRALERNGDEPVPVQGLRTRLDGIHDQSQRLTDLVEKLLDVSRVISGQFDLAMEPLDMAQLVHEVAGRFRDQAAVAECELRVDAGEGPCPGSWDRLRIEEVAGNLIANAIKFGGGKPIDITLACTSDDITFAVHDRGIGIAPEDQARIFERFEQVATPRPFGGLGLGLWIVREIVTAMGGTIKVTSALGEGAAFTVTLPR